MRILLNSETINNLENYEENYLAKCSQIIEAYKTSYADYGCKINYGLFWEKENKVYKERPSLGKGYECWFYYTIEKNGQLVCCDEVEGNTLGMAEGFIYIREKRKRLGKSLLEVVYVDEVNDLKESLEENLSMLIGICKVNYGDK